MRTDVLRQIKMKFGARRVSAQVLGPPGWEFRAFWKILPSESTYIFTFIHFQVCDNYPLKW